MNKEELIKKKAKKILDTLTENDKFLLKNRGYKLTLEETSTLVKKYVMSMHTKEKTFLLFRKDLHSTNKKNLFVV